ncbi:MAG: PAS domain S-box protein [Planctomycetota bacterium]
MPDSRQPIAKKRTGTAPSGSVRDLAMANFALEAVQDAIYLIDDTATIVDCNAAACAALGYDRADLIRMTIFDFDVGVTAGLDDPVGFWRDYWQEMVTRELVNFESRHRRKDGSTFPIEIRSRVRSFDGRLLSCAVARDISRRRAMEAELRLIKSAVDSAQEAIGIADADGHHRYQNRAFTELLGYTPAQLHARDPPTLFADPTQGEAMLAAVRAGHGWSDEAGMRSHDGSTIPVELHAGPIYDETGALVGMVGVHSDIRQRKAMEEELRNSEARYRAIIADQTDFICRFTSDGRLTFVNQALADLLGARPEDLRGTDMFARMQSAQAAEVRATLSRLTPEQPIVESNDTIAATHGVRIVEWRTRGFFAADGSLYEAQAVGRDVTAKVAAERDLAESRDSLRRALATSESLREVAEHERAAAQEWARRAEEATEAKSLFLASMSHEIRTPLNGVIGMNSLLLDGTLDDQHRRYAEAVQASGEILLDLINDILDFSKIEAKRMELTTAPFDLGLMVEDLADTQALAAHERDLELSVLVDPALPPTFLGDAVRIRQVLGNLTSNAIKFTDRGGVSIEVGGKRGADRCWELRFAVTDTGIGIPAERHDHLFEPFRQLDASATRRHGGTGLGLAISKQLVELMGGRIGVESMPGQGARFWFALTLDAAPIAAFAGPEADTTAPQRVLVVEDNQHTRTTLDRYLGWAGCVVDTAGDGATARERLAHPPGDGGYDLALIDLALPDTDAIHLARQIREPATTQAVRLILLAPLGQRFESGLLRSLGYARTLAKPIHRLDLYQCLDPEHGTTTTRAPSRRLPALRKRIRDEERRVLVVEDNAVNQLVTVGMVSRMGLAVDAAATGREAIARLEQHDYDLVLMDCQMPDMDGYAATRHVRDPASAVRNHRVPIIALTANALEGDRERCLDAGMDDHIGKPIRLEDLATALTRWIRRRDPADSADG